MHALVLGSNFLPLIAIIHTFNVVVYISINMAKQAILFKCTTILQFTPDTR